MMFALCCVWAQSAAAEMTSSTTSLGDVMTSVLRRRRPQMTLTVDAPAHAHAASCQSRRSSASIDSGYGSSPTLAPLLDLFSPPPPPPPGLGLPAGPLTAPLPSVSGQSPAWLAGFPHPAHAVYAAAARPANTAAVDHKNNELFFVFDGLTIRP